MASCSLHLFYQEQQTDSEEAEKGSSYDEESSDDGEEGVSSARKCGTGEHGYPTESTPITRLGSSLRPRRAKRRRLNSASFNSQSFSPVHSRSVSPVPHLSPISTRRSVSPLSPSPTSPRPMSVRSVSPEPVSSHDSTPVLGRGLRRGGRAVRGRGRGVRRGMVQ